MTNRPRQIGLFLTGLAAATFGLSVGMARADQFTGIMYFEGDAALAPLTGDHLSGELAFVDTTNFGIEPAIEFGTVANLTDDHPVVDGTKRLRTHDFAPAHLATTLIYEDTQGNFTPTVVREIRSLTGNETLDMWVWQNLQLEWKDSGGIWNEVNLPGGLAGGLIGAPFGQSEALHMTPDVYNDGIPDGHNRSQIRIFPDDGDTSLFGGATVHGLKFAYWEVSTEQFAFPLEPAGFAQNFLPSRDELGDFGEVHANIYGTDLMEIDVIAAGSIVESADFDGDGGVDGRDFLRWQRGFGLTGSAAPTDGDANLDGDVGGADLDVWKTQFGTVPPPISALTAVPEPSTILLCGLGLSVCLAKRRTNS